MEAGPGLYAATQRPLSAAPADLRRSPAGLRSATGRQAAQAAAADQHTHLSPLPGRPQASCEGLRTAWFTLRYTMLQMKQSSSESMLTLVGDGRCVVDNESTSSALVVERRRLSTPASCDPGDTTRTKQCEVEL